MSVLLHKLGKKKKEMSTDDILRDVEEMGKRALELEEAVGRVCAFPLEILSSSSIFSTSRRSKKIIFEILPKMCVYFELKHY